MKVASLGLARRRVLDLGCGNGVPATRMLAERFDVIGIDVVGREFIPEEPHGGHELILGIRRPLHMGR